MQVCLNVEEDRKQCLLHVWFQTESDEDVIFVSEAVPKSKDIAIDQAKRLALQKDIDQGSQPNLPTKPLKMVVVEMKAENKMKVATMDVWKENTVKKERKGKKGQATAPERDASPIDEESLGIKKRKKNQGKTAVKEEECLNSDGGGDKGSSKKKNKKKQPPEGESAGETAQGSVEEKRGVENEHRKQKKKSKLLKFEPVEEIVEGEDKEVGVTKAKKRKIKTLVVSAEETKEESKERKKKQKTKKKTKKSDEQRLEEDTDAVKEVTVGKKVKTELKAAIKEEEEGSQHKPKKKKSGKDHFEAVTKEEKEETDIKPSKKRSKSTNGVKEEGGEPERKKKKGLKEKKEEEEPKKKRKKASSKGEETETSLKQVKEVETGKKKKNRKKSSSEVEMKAADEKAAEEGVETKKRKKKKIKLEPMDSEEQEDHGVPQTDVVFLSEKTGNKDEVNINQERRLALQMDVDKASQPGIPAKPSGFGQWGSAQFDSSDQQQKFLRLMGGFKKGTQPTGANTGQANMALGKEAQQSVQQALLGEFERAQSRRMDFGSRGAGLGFTAPSKKKFSIDISASRSVRFDD